MDQNEGQQGKPAEPAGSSPAAAILASAAELAELAGMSCQLSSALLGESQGTHGSTANHIGYRLRKQSEALDSLAGDASLDRHADVEFGAVAGQVLLASIREVARRAAPLSVTSTTEPSPFEGDDPLPVHVLARRTLTAQAPVELNRYHSASGVRLAVRRMRHDATEQLARVLALELWLSDEGEK